MPVNKLIIATSLSRAW